MATAPAARPRRERLRDPVWWSQAIQLVKTAAAAVIAWVIATTVLDLPQSFLAPWAALLVVHSTVYRTVRAGRRQVAAAVVGVLLAWGVGNALGRRRRRRRVVLLLGLLLGAVPGSGDEATTPPRPPSWCSRPASPTRTSCSSRLADTRSASVSAWSSTCSSGRR